MEKQGYNRLRLGLNIRIRRHAMRMTQDELAEKVHCSRQTVSSLERGKRDISVEMLFAICRALEYPVKELLAGIG